MDIRANLYRHSHMRVTGADTCIVLCGPGVAQGKAHVSDAWTYAKKEHSKSLFAWLLVVEPMRMLGHFLYLIF
jgi:hypothetical protein